MPLYFRSDTRPPDVIFSEGFNPWEDHGDNWWVEALNLDGYQNTLGMNNKSIDANLEAAICLTTKFESAPIFPLAKAKDFTYVYILALPEAIKAYYVSKRGDIKLVSAGKMPRQATNMVIDLHSLQVTQTANIVTFFKPHAEKDEPLAAYAGWPLYAYEAIAHHVSPLNIIGAIRIHRHAIDPAQELKITSPAISTKEKSSLDRTFNLDGDLVDNPRFCLAQHISTTSGILTLDYSTEINNTISLIEELKAQDLLRTPNIYFGLGGKTF